MADGSCPSERSFWNWRIAELSGHPIRVKALQSNYARIFYMEYYPVRTHDSLPTDLGEAIAINDQSIILK